jgi:chromosome segregation and condensation protein ScpB
MWAFRGVEDGSALAMTSGGSRLSPDAVVAGAIEVLADYPYLAAALPERRICTSVEATWPDPPHPLIFWLYVAASSGLVGSGAARACVSSLEAIVALLKTTTLVSGAWQRRFSRLLPKPRAATYDDGTEFRAALFELIGAFRLVTTGTAVQLQGDGPTPSCDLLIGSAGTPFVGVEVYCPQKGAEAWYRDSVQQPWQSLISGDSLRIEDVEPAPGRVVDISTRTYERLREALSLCLPAAPALLRRPVPQEWTERQLATLAACVLSGCGGSLAALAAAAGVAIAAVREQLSMLGDRLAAVGMCAVEDGDVVRLMPLSWAADAVAEVATLEVEQVLSGEAVEILVIVGMLGSPTRRAIQELRGGEDCEGLLTWLCRRGLLVKARDDSLRGDPNIYRITATALGVMGHATLESFEAQCRIEVESLRVATASA